MSIRIPRGSIPPVASLAIWASWEGKSIGAIRQRIKRGTIPQSCLLSAGNRAILIDVPALVAHMRERRALRLSAKGNPAQEPQT